MSRWVTQECPIKRRHEFLKSKWNYKMSYQVAHAICGVLLALDIIGKKQYPLLCRRISRDFDLYKQEVIKDE